MTRVFAIMLSAVIFFMLGGCHINGDNRKKLEEDARSMFRQGQAAYNAGKTDSAIHYFKEIGNRFAASDDSVLRNIAGEAYNTVGVIYFIQGRYPESIKCLIVAEQAGNDTTKAGVYNNMAGIYHYFNDNEKAVEYLERSLEGSINTREWDILRSSGLNVLNYYFEADQPDKVSSVVDRLSKLSLPKDDLTAYLFQTGYGMRAAITDSLARAKSYFRKAIDISSRMEGGERYVIMSYNHLARTLMLEGRYREAIAYLDTVAALCGGEKQADTFMAVCDMKAECYKALGESKAEIDSRMKFVAVKDSLFSAKEFGKVLDLQAAHKIGCVEKNLVVEKELRLKSQQLAWTLTILVLLTSGVGVWIWLQNKRLRDAMRVLYEKTKGTPDQEAGTEHEEEAESAQEEEDSSVRTEDEAPQEEQTAGKGVLDDESAQALAKSIVHIMETEKPYLTPSFSVKELADLTNSNSKYVSYVLNNVLGKSFPSFVNSYRIQEACARLRSEANERAFTIESIALEVGFRSRTSFNVIFKKITGLTPKEYIQMAREDKK